MTMDSELTAWMLKVTGAGSASTNAVASIHLDELDRKLADPATWEQAITDCLPIADAVRLRHEIPYEVAVGIPVSPPVTTAELGAPALRRIVERRTAVTPVVCLFRRGHEPWEVTEREFEGECERYHADGYELHLCKWWDPDDERLAGGVWVRLR
ncbi:MAG TPA: hypothetical protein VFJ82_21095 [Longimicrobium sp.]|nr:hypothetical protein [Longimicrobium sp.]